MEMFEGKEGLKIYERREDAKFIAERKTEIEKTQVSIVEIRILEEETVKNLGISVHPDLSVAARKPEEGDKGWVVTCNPDSLEKKSGDSFEILSEQTFG